MEYPVENILQYTTKSGIHLVAVPPENDQAEPWFQDMINSYGLSKLVQFFPYVVLELDPNTGKLVQKVQTNYNARITNAFHIYFAKEVDSINSVQNGLNSAVITDLDKAYELHLEQAYDFDPPNEVRDIGIESDKLIYDEKSDNNEEVVEFSNDKMPEYAQLDPLPEGWHPNKDEYGRYIKNIQQQNPYGYYSNYNYPNMYYGTPSFVPRYLPNNMYPF